MARAVKTETPTMALVSERLKQGHATVEIDRLRELYPDAFADPRVVTQHEGKDLRTFMTEGRGKTIDLGDGTMTTATWDDVAFDLRTITGVRVVRESTRNWAQRYGIQEPEHDYGVGSAVDHD